MEALLQMAKHGAGANVFLIRFHYLPPGGWDVIKEKTDRRRRLE